LKKRRFRISARSRPGTVRPAGAAVDLRQGLLLRLAVVALEGVADDVRILLQRIT